MPQPRSRQVRVFISSTFRDMQAERNHLVRFVFPELEQRCSARGVLFVAVDLRWGVTREEAESGEALRICLEEAAGCRPYFLCLLGERYGWTPLPPEVAAPEAARLAGEAERLFATAYRGNEGYGEFVLRSETERQEAWGADREQHESALLTALAAAGVGAAGLSITAQEIEHGVLSAAVGPPDAAEEGRSLFYFREPALTAALASAQQEDYYERRPEGQDKLVALKQRIVAAGLAPRTYGDVEGLGDLVCEELWERIAHDFPEQEPGPSDLLSEERQAQEQFVGRLTRFFVGRAEALDALDGLVERDQGYAAVLGPAGCGKTALLAQWLYGPEGFAARHPQTLVLSHFVGASTRSANLPELLARLCRELARRRGLPETPPATLSRLVSRFSRLLRLVARDQRLVIVLDALDQLEPAGNAHSLHWLPGTLPPGATIVASAQSGPQVEGAPATALTAQALRSRAGANLVALLPLPRPSVDTMAVEYLRHFRKRLSAEQLALLAGKSDAGSPLYLQTALDELLSFGEYEGVTDYVRLLPETLAELYEAVLAHLESEHGREFVGRVMSCLACGRYGMTEAELLAIASPEAPARAPGSGAQRPVATLRWTRLRRTLAPHLLQRGATLGFYHGQLRQAVERRYLAADETRRQVHATLAAHFEARPLSDRRKLEEQPYQQVRGRQWERLTATLCDYGFMEAKLRGPGAGDLVADHERAMARGSGLPAEQAAVLRPLGEALRLGAHILTGDPEQLPAQLCGRLLGVAAEQAPVRALLADVRERPRRPWLRPVSASLAQAGGPLLRTLGGHRGPVSTVAVTPDCALAVAAAGHYGPAGTVDVWELRVWDLATGADLACLLGHVRPVYALALTADGRLAVSGSGDGVLRVWDVAAGAERGVLRGHRGEVRDVAVTPDGHLALSGATDKTLRLWDLAAGKELRTISGHDDWLWSVALTADGRLAAAADFGHAIKVWELATGTALRSWACPGGLVHDLAVTPDGRLVLAAADKSVWCWEIASGELRFALEGHRAAVCHLAVTTDGGHLISRAADNTIKLWDLDTGDELQTTTPELRLQLRAAAVVAYANTVQVWDLAPGGDPPVASGHSGRVQCVAVIPRGDGAVSAGADGTLRVWELGTGAPRHTLRHGDDWVHSVTALPDGRRAVSANGGLVRVWDLDRGTELGAWGTRGATQATSPDAAVLVTGVPAFRPTSAVGQAMAYAAEAAGRTHAPVSLLVRDMRTGAERELRYHDNAVSAVVFTPDGRRVVSASHDRTLKTWDPLTGKALRTLHGHGTPVQGVAVTPDGHLAVSHSAEGVLKVWDLARGTELRTLRGHRQAVRAIAITADGSRVLSASEDKTVRVWEIATGGLVHTLTGHGGAVVAIEVTPDGRRAVSASTDATLRLWDLLTGEQLCLFSADAAVTSCAIAPDGLSIVAGDEAGRVHLLVQEHTVAGPPLCTPWQAPASPLGRLLPLGGRTPLAFGCPHCRAWSETPGSALGAELPCPRCGKAISLTSFAVRGDWRPLSLAWRPEQAEG